MVKKRACVFISGAGTNLKSIINYSRDYNFPINVNLIISNNKKHSKIDFPDWQFSFSLCFHSHYFRDLALYEVFLQSELSRDVFLTFWYPSLLKHLVLRAFLAGHLPKKLSQISILYERGMNKSKKNIAPEWCPSICCCKNIYKMRDLELIRGSAGLSGLTGSGVSSRCSDPPQHAPEVRMTWVENKLPQSRGIIGD